MIRALDAILILPISVISILHLCKISPQPAFAVARSLEERKAHCIHFQSGMFALVLDMGAHACIIIAAIFISSV